MTTNMLDYSRQRELFRILFAFLCFCLQMPGIYASKLLQLDPPSIVVRHGSPASVNCSTNVTHQGIGWEASQGSVGMKLKVQLITWTVESLQHWDIKPICYINADEQVSLPVNIIVYKPPDQVSISSMNHTNVMTEGRQYTLQCDVQNVAPARLLIVKWYKEQELIKHENFSDQNISAVDKKSTLQISPRRDDDGVQYRCEAELKLGPEGPQPPPKVASDPLNITVHFGPEINCSDVVQLNEGERLTDYCKVTGNPFPHFYWQRERLTIDPSVPLNRTSSGEYKIIINGNDIRFLRVEVIYGPEISCGLNNIVPEGDYFIPNCMVVGYPPIETIWYKDEDVVEFPKIMHRNDAGQYTLTTSNSNTFFSHTLEINVLYPPTEITELHNAQPYIGEDAVLKCSSNAKPRPTYKWIYHQTANVQIENQDGVSLLHINHAGGDNIGTYTCIAYNHLGEVNQTVRVDVQGAKATCPLIISPPHVYLEYGKSVNLECHSDISNADLSWKISDTVINSSTLVMNSTWFVDSLGWNGHASCHGKFVGLNGCQKDLDVIIYNRPDQVFISALGHAEPMIEGKNYTLQCDITNVAPVQFLIVNWYEGQKLVGKQSFPMVKELTDITSTLRISPSRNNPNIQYNCEAELKLGPKSPFKVKSHPLDITVHYKPTIKEKMPQWVPLFDGYQEVLVCEATGYPKPTITWIFNNDRLEAGNMTEIKNAGEYTCIASNSVGNDTRVVTVVLKDDSCELVLRPPELLVEYGASASVDCSTVTPSNHKGMGWKASQGAVDKMEDVQLISWKVDSLVHWDIQPICFLNTLAGHCQMKLPVTVYRRPDRVSISTVGRTGPMIEGKHYELQCDVYNVAPVQLLTVNWYKGQHLVAKTSFSDSTKTPVNQSTRFHMSPSRADDGVRYRCEAELKLSRREAGTHASFKVASQVLGLTVHYSPQFTSVVEIFNETTEDFALNCTVMANPPPRYAWHSPNLRNAFNTGHPVLYVSSLGSGNYTCTASNGIGSISKVFIVQAKPRGGNRTMFWVIVGPFVGLAVLTIIGYVLVKRRTIKK